MQEKQEKLNIGEQEGIAEAVLRLVAAYPNYPSAITQKKISLDDLKDAESIGIFPTSGAVILKRYISGAFEAQFPFNVCYKCRPTDNAAAVAKRNVLEGLCKWLESTDYPELSDGRMIQSIQRTSTAVLAGKTEDGSSVFQCSVNLKYFRKRR